MNKEFCLSDEGQVKEGSFIYPNKQVWYYEEDVKEAVRLLKEELSGWDLQRGMSDSKCHGIIDKIFGDKLVEKTEDEN